MRNRNTAGHLPRATRGRMAIRRGALQGHLPVPDPSRAHLDLDPDRDEPGTISRDYDATETVAKETRHHG